MTRLPAENRDVKGVSGDQFPKYKVGPICSVPGCSRLADHAHHIWRRSFLSGDYAWVKLWDGQVLGNLTGLCWRHHEAVTVNKAKIMWNGTSYVWHDMGEVGTFQLDPQPPGWGFDHADDSESDEEEEFHLHGPGAVEKCPTCRRAMPRERQKHDVKRPRKNWTISVPVDAREDGAEALDVLLGECSKLFGHDETKATRFFTLIQSLALVVQHGHRMVSDE